MLLSAIHPALRSIPGDIAVAGAFGIFLARVMAIGTATPGVEVSCTGRVAGEMSGS